MVQIYVNILNELLRLVDTGNKFKCKCNEHFGLDILQFFKKVNFKKRKTYVSHVMSTNCGVFSLQHFLLY